MSWQALLSFIFSIRIVGWLSICFRRVSRCITVSSSRKRWTSPQKKHGQEKIPMFPWWYTTIPHGKSQKIVVQLLTHIHRHDVQLIWKEVNKSQKILVQLLTMAQIAMIFSYQIWSERDSKNWHPNIGLLTFWWILTQEWDVEPRYLTTMKYLISSMDEFEGTSTGFALSCSMFFLQPYLADFPTNSEIRETIDLWNPPKIDVVPFHFTMVFHLWSDAMVQRQISVVGRGQKLKVKGAPGRNSQNFCVALLSILHKNLHQCTVIIVFFGPAKLVVAIPVPLLFVLMYKNGIPNFSVPTPS